MEKIDDLENRPRRSNLSIIGIPETYKAADLYHLCSNVLPKALGLDSQYIVERAHRLGALMPDKKVPRLVIAKYLNYANKNQILQRFCAQR